MNVFIEKYIDLAVLVLCFVFTVLTSLRYLRTARLPLRLVPAFFALFGATAVATFIGAGHLFEISYHAFERLAAGTFKFDFRFYALIQMGLVILALSGYMVGQIGAWFRGEVGAQRNAVRVALVLMAFTLPTVAFTPIGAVPTIGCVISLLTFPFVVKKRRVLHHAPATPVS